MKAKKNKRERSQEMRQVSAGLRDVLGMTQMEEAAFESDISRDRRGGRWSLQVLTVLLPIIRGGGLSLSDPKRERLQKNETHPTLPLHWRGVVLLVYTATNRGGAGSRFGKMNAGKSEETNGASDVR